MQRLNVRWLALLAITLIAIYLCWLIVLPFIDVVIWSLVLAVIAYPVHCWFMKKGMNDTWAAVSTVTSFVLVALVPITFVAISAVSQVPEAMDTVQQGIAKVKEVAESDTRVGHYVQKFLNHSGTDTQSLIDEAKGYIAPLAKQSLGVVGGLVGAIVKIGFTMFALFYLLRDAKLIGRAVMNALPLEEWQSLQVFRRCRDVIKASVEGVMVIAAIQGFLGGVAFAVLGLPSAILWGFVMFVTAMIPVVGTALVWVPAAIYLAAIGHYWKAVILVGFCAGVIGMIDNLLRPPLVGKKAGLHDLVIFFSVLGGLHAFGFPGLFVGPVIVALTFAIVEVFKHMSPTRVTGPGPAPALPAGNVPPGDVPQVERPALQI
ncbi:MAG: AI-2E family transporter [Tepidisphaeraceae bacterium]